MAQVFNQTTAQAVVFEEIGAIVVKDVSLLEGLSPASVGGSGRMPVIGDDYYLSPANLGAAGTYFSPATIGTAGTVGTAGSPRESISINSFS